MSDDRPCNCAGRSGGQEVVFVSCHVGKECCMISEVSSDYSQICDPGNKPFRRCQSSTDIYIVFQICDGSIEMSIE